MSQIKEILVEEMQDLLHAEMQLTEAIPKMVQAAHHPKLKEAFEKHLEQTRMQVERLKQAFELLEEEAQPKPCKGMMGLIEEGQEVIEQGQEKEPLAADLCLITAAQKVEHYEVAGYGTVRTLARQLGLVEVAGLLSRSLGEEESADHLLTVISQPILQQATLDDMGAEVDLETVPVAQSAKAEGKSRKVSGR